jgi:ribosomal protein L12E/L44/L45/RPP1/RPP2
LFRQPKGNAQLVDDVSDNENLQFITVTARDGNVFYFVIDKGAQSENVYFLNTVDESDLEALVEKSDKKPTSTAKPEQTENTAETDSTENDKKNTDSKTEKTEQPEQNRPKNNSGLFIILALAAAAGIGGYYYKVVLPKKKLEQADDLDDFDFEDEDTETVVNEDEETDE